MLSKETPNSSMRQFVEYVANVHDVRSVLLQYFPLQSLPLTVDSICSCPFNECGCIVFWTREDVRVMVAEQIPGTLKPLFHSLCLLPSLDCLKNGCHGCNEGLLHVEEIEDASYLKEIEEIIEDDEIGRTKQGETKANESGTNKKTDVEEIEANDLGTNKKTDVEEIEANDLGTNKKTDVEETKANEFETNKKRLKEGEPKVVHSAAVCGISYSSTFRLGDPATCICIPVLQEGYDRGNDRWTKLLIGYFKSKDYETRGAIIRREKRSVSDDLENYMDQKGKCYAAEEYSIVSLIVPRLTEIVINLILTFWFKVDGFSSSLVARRAVRDYIVDNSGRGFAAHVFMNKAEVRSNEDNANAYQVLSFRGNLWNPRALSVIVGLVNLSCSITWGVLVAMEGGSNKWYHTHSMAPSKGRLLVIFVGIAIALVMDCVDLYLYFPNARSSIKRWFHRRTKTDEEKRQEETQERLERARKGAVKEWRYNRRRKYLIVCTMIVFEILCIVSISVVARALGVKAFGKWVYSGVQGLVWLKWGIGSYLVGQYIPPECSGAAWTYGSTGIYMYSSAFGLNAILAGARAKWEFF